MMNCQNVRPRQTITIQFTYSDIQYSLLFVAYGSLFCAAAFCLLTNKQMNWMNWMNGWMNEWMDNTETQTHVSPLTSRHGHDLLVWALQILGRIILLIEYYRLYSTRLSYCSHCKPVQKHVALRSGTRSDRSALAIHFNYGYHEQTTSVHLKFLHRSVKYTNNKISK